MEKLLSRTVPSGPRSVRSENGGALLAVSLHCAPLSQSRSTHNCKAVLVSEYAVVQLGSQYDAVQAASRAQSM